MLAVSDLLMKLFERIKNNDPRLNFIDWKDQVLTDQQMHQLYLGLLNNIYITEVILPAAMHNHQNYSQIQEIAKKNKKAQQLLLVEQTITLAQGARQGGSLINRLPTDVLVMIIIILSAHLGRSTENVQAMANMLIAHVRSSQVGHLEWKKTAEFKGKKFTLFQAWSKPNQYFENVIRYTRDYQQAINDIPHLRELIKSWFMLWMAMTALPELKNYSQNQSQMNQKPMTQTKLFDIFMQFWFAQQAKMLKNKNLISNEEEIIKGFWKYATSLAQDMHKLNIKIINFENYCLNKTMRDPQLHRLWRKYFDPVNPHFAYCQEACLIKKIGAYQYAFVDNLLFDYFFSCKQFENITGHLLVAAVSNVPKKP